MTNDHDVSARRLLFAEAAKKARESRPCPDCGGAGGFPNEDPYGPVMCASCDGTGIEFMRESQVPRRDSE